MEKETFYEVYWERPKIYSNEPTKAECCGGFKTIEEAERYSQEVCHEYSDCSDYHRQVHMSMKVRESGKQSYFIRKEIEPEN